MERRTGNPRGLTPDGPKIRKLRVDRGLTVVQLAEAVGRMPLTVRKIELYSFRTSEVTASRIARALSLPAERVTVDDITVSDDIESEPEPKVPAA